MKTKVKVINLNENKKVVFETTVTHEGFEDFADKSYEQMPEEVQYLLDNDFWHLPVIVDEELAEQYFNYLNNKYK